MSLRIDLYKPSHSDPRAYDPRVYVPGDPVQGNVVYPPSKQVTLKSAILQFTGKIETSYEDSSSMRQNEKVELFYFEKKLFDGPYDIQAKPLELPFQFTFPTQSSHVQRLGEQEQPDPNFLTSGVSDLPPTDHVSLSGWHHSEASVKYRLKAKLDAGSLESQSLEKPLRLRRVALTPSPEPIFEWHRFPRTIWESRNLRAASHDIKTKFRHVFSKDPELKTPCLRFDAVIQWPKAISRTQSTAIRFAIQHVWEGPADPVEPTLYLSSVNFELYNAAYAKMGRDRQRSADDGPEIEHTFRLEDCVLPLNGEPVLVTEDTKMQDWGKGDLWRHVGDYKTYLIHHFHMMKVKAEVKHVDPDHTYNLEKQFYFQLLDPLYRGEWY